jgi:hypothetical protein
MALILDKTKQLDFHTDMGEVIKPFKEEMKSLNWILTNQDYILFDQSEKGFVDKLDNESEIIYFEGLELLEILESREIQFIWGVFCGTKEKIGILAPEEMPYADLNSDIWTKPDEFLLASSEIEIICFDSNYTIAKFRDPKLEARWKMKFTDAKELKKENVS